MQSNLKKLIEFEGKRPISEAPKDGSEVLLQWSYLYPGDKHATTGQGFYNWSIKDACWEDEEGAHNPELFTHYTPRDALERLAKVVRHYENGICEISNLSEEGYAAALRIFAEAEQIAGETPCK